MDELGLGSKKIQLIGDFLSIIFLLVVISPVILSYRQAGFFPTHDGQIHLTRIEEFHKAFSSGQIPVRLAPDLLKGAGYPLFVVNYHLPYYLTEALLSFGLTPIQSFQLLMIIAYVAYVLFSFIFFSRLSGNLGGLLGAALVAYAPYTFANMFTRGALAEMVAVAIIPLVFLSAHYLVEKSDGRNMLVDITPLALSMGALLLAHTLVAGFTIPLIILYVLVFSKKRGKELFVKILISVVWVMGIASFGLLPAIFERGYFAFDEKTLSLWRGHLLPFFSILRLPIGGASLATPYQVGIVHLFLSLLALIFLVFRKVKRQIKLFAFFAATFLVSIFMVSKPSVWMWEMVPISQFILFPWRLLTIAVFASASLAALLLSLAPQRHKWLLAVVIFFAIYTSRHYRRPTVFPNDAFLLTNQFTTATTENEYNPIGMDERIGKKQRPDVEFLSGGGKISEKVKRIGSLTFEAVIEEESLIQTNILYFPGWRLYIDGRPQFVNTQVSANMTNGLNGLISFWLPKGTHQVNIVFGETPLRLLADLISGFSLLMFILLSISCMIKCSFQFFKPARYKKKHKSVKV